MFTFVSILMVIFAAGATNSATQVAFAKTNISIHMLTDVFALIGFEVDRKHLEYQKRAWRASIPRPVT